MKYQSELIKEIIDTRGHDKSSLHYESECIESWIAENKGAYPKLCDYQSEWLNYINENPIGEFPYETLVDVTEATINNVVPYAYKSAILKGQTLVNIPTTTEQYTTNKNIKDWVATFEYSTHLVKANTKYYIGIFNHSNESKTYGLRLDPFAVDTEITINSNGYGFLIGTTVENITSKALVINKASHTENNNVEVLFIEYQQGMENWDIPYFEGMQSVKMPVLKTTGMNLVNPNELMNGTLSNANAGSGYKHTPYIKVEPDTKYNFRITDYIHWFDSNKNKLRTDAGWGAEYRLYTSPSNAKYVVIDINTGTFSKYNASYEDVSMIKSDINVSEPYKSNILTVNDVTLRGIGNIKDELDCLTGKVTERIGEIVLDGMEEWNVSGHSQWTTCYTRKYILPHLINKGTSLVSDKMMSYIYYDYLGSNDVIGISITNEGYICFKYLPNGSKPQPSEVSDYLKSNPITIQYPLETESVKTVALTVINQNGENVSLKPIEGTMHLSTSSETINPLFSGEIPVEAITQNLASFIEE